MNRVAARILLGLFAVGVAASASADGLRCGQRLITDGDHETKLLHYCGEPLAVESRAARRLYVGELETGFFPGVFTDIRVEEWTYNFGPRKLMRLIRIEDGIVTEIRHLGYGFIKE